MQRFVKLVQLASLFYWVIPESIHTQPWMAAPMF